MLRLASCLLFAVADASLLDAPLFSSGMILQRGAGTRLWGANATGPVTVTVSTGGAKRAKATSAAPAAGGAWSVSLPAVAAAQTSTVTITDGQTTDTLSDVAWGDVLLCGGQSNMGFGMCGATVIASGPHPQTPTQALAALPMNNPIRFFNQHGDRNGGAGSTVRGNVCKEPCTTSNNGMDAKAVWYKAGKDNAGSASAVCLLTAQSLRAKLGGGVPVGAVNSCVGGTPVAPWTPPAGALYLAHIKPLLPMRFLAALWDQGERDAKTTNTTWYGTEFPRMITGWRAALESPELPFVYVELCHELGAVEPKERNFWEYGQRAALRLPRVGFATTTDVDKSALHPPDKQDIAPRMAAEVMRLAHGQPVVSRGPEFVSAAFKGGGARSQLLITLSNASLVVHKGVVVPPPAGGCSSTAGGGVVTQVNAAGKAVAVPFTIHGRVLTVTCTPGTEKEPVLVNGDASMCFLYSGETGLPAPPLAIPCSSAAAGL